MVMFSKNKEAALRRKDHSKKGSIDEEVVPALEAINAMPDFYTTSSCAGRIVLLREPRSRKKKDFEWLYVSHSEPDITRIRAALDKLPKDKVWLRMEPFIIHVCSRDMGSAERFLAVMRKAGLKHSGILAARKRIVIEVAGNERMDVPVAAEGRMLVGEEYLGRVTREAWDRLVLSRKRLALLTTMLSTEVK